MSRRHTAYVCQQCGTAHSRWSGRCDACGAWNSLVEEAPMESVPKGLGGGSRSSGNRGHGVAFVPLRGAEAALPRKITGIAEFDRVCGGGLVAGSALLVGGDPGIGKSTLLLQVAAALAPSARVVYISGEEAIDQVRLRAARLGLAEAPVGLGSATSVRDIVAALDNASAPDVVVVDSIQTLYVDTLESAPGTVAQVRSSAHEMIRLAKRRGFVLFLVGHVTKEGVIAGPRVLEHMVDTVLYFEGDRSHHFRILRAVKNRFGPGDEIGVFEMTDSGLIEVSNPSELFLADRRTDAAGSAVFAGIEGTRPVLVEIQALIASAAPGTPRRAVVGWDGSRLAMVLAVLEARCGLALGSADVYLNVAGGLRIAEPAADLAVAAALVSSLSGVPLPPDTVVFGEIGLAGEVRPVARSEARLKEAVKLGFRKGVIPEFRRGRKPKGEELQMRCLSHLAELVALFDLSPAGARRLPDRRRPSDAESS